VLYLQYGGVYHCRQNDVTVILYINGFSYVSICAFVYVMLATVYTS